MGRSTWIDHTCTVAADVDAVFALLSDMDRWPEWVPGMLAIRRRGSAPPVAGCFFLMTLAAPRLGRLWLPNVVYRLDRNVIEWGGGLAGAGIRHGFELMPLGDGATRVRHYEYATGLLRVLAAPAAGFAYRHDRRWSDTLVSRFQR